MDKITLVVSVVVVILFSCHEKKSESRYLSKSSGNINNISVIIDNELWKGKIGDSIRTKISPYLYGLPQDEKRFSLNQMPPNVFSDFVKKNRLILKIQKSENCDIRFVKNLFAKPQLVVTVIGKNDLEIIELLSKNADRIIKSFNKVERKEKKSSKIVI